MRFPRSSGLLLHPTSLPGPFGIGDLGPESYSFANFLIASGQTLWQILPLGPTGYGDSPYACYSAFAGNTLLISPELLLAAGLLTDADLSDAPAFPEQRVDFEAVQQFKETILKQAFDRFSHARETPLHAQCRSFCEAQAHWLDDYALFRALKDVHGGRAWTEWDTAFARRESIALDRAREALREAIAAQKFYQFIFFRQWFDLKAFCNDRGVRILGDIPIFVAHDSADVWTNPDQFKLNPDGMPQVVAGVPPDYFSSTGQRWGNPLYDWAKMQADGFRWWIERVRATLQTVDLVRIDHFRGFVACWEIPGRDQTAERGQWVAAPGRGLFKSIREALGTLPIIAEDLGVITPEVDQLRDDFSFPGMRILQFAFSSDSLNRDLPHNYQPNVVVYTGTHDNDTTVGWFNSVAGDGSTRDPQQIEEERQFALKYLNAEGTEIHWDFIRAVLASVADTAVVPLQDLLGLGSEARMNLPSSTAGNWCWRLADGVLQDDLAGRLRELTRLYGRVT